METSSWVHLRKHIYPLINQNVQLYLRYIDDMFFKISQRIERTHLLNQKSQPTSKIISLILRYNLTLPDIKRAVNKHWDILKINRYFEQFFTEPSIIAFIRIGNVQDILGTKTVISNRKQVCQNIDHNNYSKH